MEEFNGKSEMLQKLYNIREENIGIIDEKLKDKLNQMILEKLQKQIEENIADNKKQNEITKSLELLIENYELKMSSFTEQAYKQGFKDAFKLFTECTK